LRVHLLDGTYELFRHHFGVPSHRTAHGVEVAAARGALASIVALLEQGATHLGVATDHVIESFRNDLWPGYKTSAGVPGELAAQFGLFEDGVRALGVALFAMVEVEADDALASLAAVAAADPAVDQVLVLTPDKDLGQCVVGDRVVQVDRRRDRVLDEAAVTEKMGVPPALIPDYLALVGDSADGFPGLPGFGAKTAAAVLNRFGSIEAIPDDPSAWDTVAVRGAPKLAATLAGRRDLALLFRRLATLDAGCATIERVDELAWRGPSPGLAAFAATIDAPRLADRVAALVARDDERR
jgi:5'-3' exonuclease